MAAQPPHRCCSCLRHEDIPLSAAGLAALSRDRRPRPLQRRCLALLLAVPGAAQGAECRAPLAIAYPADRPPLSFAQQAQPAGLSADYLRLLGARTPLRAHPVPATALAGQALPADTQALLGWPVNQLPPGWLHSLPYQQMPQVIVRHRDAPPLLGLDQLRAQRVASVDTEPLARHLSELAPGAQLLQVPSVAKGMQLLATGQVEAVVARLVEVEAALRQEFGDLLVIAAPAGFDDALVLAVAPACAEVLARFDRQLRQQSDAQRAAMRATWVPHGQRLAQAPRSSLRWLVPALLIVLALGMVHALGYWRLHREGVRRRALQQRLDEVSEHLPAVVYQARRSRTGYYSVPYIAGDVQAVFGISVDSARADPRRLLAAVHPADRRAVLACVDAAALAHGPIDVTFRTRGADGWRWVHSHGQPVSRGDSHVEWSGYWMDVSAAQARARALAAARSEAEQAAVAQAHFLATMSHEIRTPMSTLLGMLERLAGSDLQERQRQLLATVEEAARMLRQILDDVLDSQSLHATPLQLQATDLRALAQAVQRLLAPVAASRGLYLRCELDPALQRGSLADGLRLRQILLNLVGNALKFTLKGGVLLRLQVLQQRDAGQRLHLQVVDTGVGISPARQRAVFAAYTQAEASTTRRFGGSGLGLAICRDLAASMGAQLQLHSVPGRGTTVGLELELAACQAPATGLPAQRAPLPRLPPLPVLAVDDHPTNLQLLVWRLRELGLQVQAYADGEQAWQAWQTQSFALVITDCHMPGMDGFALARAIRADPRAPAARVPIIALTASVLERTREACREAGMDHFLAKPVEPADLHAAISALLPATTAVEVGVDSVRE